MLSIVTIGYKALLANRKEQSGQNKFNEAITKLRMDKQFDNPCLGTSVLRKYSYTELNDKSIEEIKELAKIDPGSC